MSKKLGVYIHIPFCERKCYYCSFLSFACDESSCINDEMTNYVDCLCREIAVHGLKLKNKYKIDTIFIGGGTPSILPLGQVEKLLTTLQETFNISQKAEITIESNPNSLKKDKLKEYANSGVNRISIGVQSFNNKILKNIGRVHREKQIYEAIDMVHGSKINNFNLDLIFGLPGQSMLEWEDTIYKTIESSATHVSLYSLELEEDTKFYTDYKSGKLNLPTSILDREMYHTGINQLQKVGLNHYEISNVATLPCVHNLKYWSMAEYLGIGLGASSYLDNRRWKNHETISSWRNLIEQGQIPVDKNGCKEDTIQNAMSIFCFTSLRTCEGIVFKKFYEIWKKDFNQVYGEEIEVLKEYEQRGLIKITDKNIALSKKGIDISNEIMGVFINLKFD